MKLLKEMISMRRIGADRDNNYDVERDPKDPAYSYVPGTRDHEIDITNDKPCPHCKCNPCECDRDEDTVDMYNAEDEEGMQEECPACNGTGRDYGETCVRCGGKGHLVTSQNDNEDYPRNWQDWEDVEVDPFRQGAAAFRAGEGEGDNPYQFWSSNYKEWNTGYNLTKSRSEDSEEDCEMGLGKYGQQGMAMQGGPSGWEEEEDSPCPRCHCNPCRCDEEDQEEGRELDLNDDTDDTLAGTDPGGEEDVDIDLDLGDNKDGSDQETDVELDAVTDNVSEDPNRQGLIRKVKGAHLVYKRKTEDGTYEELWIYNSGNNLRDELEIRKAVLAGTDIPAGRTASPDGKQQYEIWSAGNAEMLQIQGLPN